MKLLAFCFSVFLLIRPLFYFSLLLLLLDCFVVRLFLNWFRLY